MFNDAAARQSTVPAAEEQIRLAAAALLFHVIAVDGVVTEDERATLKELLARRFGLDPEAAAALARQAQDAEAEAVDLFTFTHVLKAALELDDRVRIIEMMWQLVYADGSIHEFEDNAVWRVAELLGVPSETRIRLKQTVRERVRS